MDTANGKVMGVTEVYINEAEVTANEVYGLIILANRFKKEAIAS
jgi:hypothetical protein